jgi:hypothetical protein
MKQAITTDTLRGDARPRRDDLFPAPRSGDVQRRLDELATEVERLEAEARARAAARVRFDLD